MSRDHECNDDCDPEYCGQKWLNDIGDIKAELINVVTDAGKGGIHDADPLWRIHMYGRITFLVGRLTWLEAIDAQPVFDRAVFEEFKAKKLAEFDEDDRAEYEKLKAEYHAA